MKKPSKFEIGKEWTAGFAAALAMTSGRSLSESDHWLAGWDAGYEARKTSGKHESLNRYLVSIGYEPMGIVSLCSNAESNRVAPAPVAAIESLKAAAVLCDISMETAAMHNVFGILPPAYRDSWATAHKALAAALAAMEEPSK